MEELRDIPIIAAIALTVILAIEVVYLRGAARQRALESDLTVARTEIDRLRARLTEATRPPTQFARMRVREAAVDRLARLRLARRSPTVREETFARR